VALLGAFSAPGGLTELSESDRQAWSESVSTIMARFTADFPQFYDPTVSDTPDDATQADIVWSAFPASLLRDATSQRQRWTLADAAREHQDEYCEWSVERNGDGKITRVTFTSEVREYWELTAERDPDLLLSLYHEFVDPSTSIDDLIVDGVYRSDNVRNSSTSGRLAHLVQENNNLAAAVDLAAKATVLRERDGKPIVSKQDLVACAQLGNPFRNSDPQIAAGVNDAAARGAEVTFADPPGLHIKGLITVGIETPDGADPVDFWTIERGTPEHTVRASFAVPAGRGYAVGDIRIGGRPIEFGAQLADKVMVRLQAIAKDADHEPERKPCERS
jgi:hypothetical protein